jgi:hypothetical protein
MTDYALAVGLTRLAERLFGPSLEVLADVPANRIGQADQALDDR